MGKGDFGQAKQSGVHDRLVKHLELVTKRTDVIPAKTSEGEFRGTAKRGSSDFRAAGFPEFTNEVQHPIRGVLRWDPSMVSSRLRRDVRLPGVATPGNRSGKWRQVWIARHRALLGS